MRFVLHSLLKSTDHRRLAEDQWFGEKLQRQTEAEFAQRKDELRFELKQYEGTAPCLCRAVSMIAQSFDYNLATGTVHGFAARPNMANATIKKAFADALEQAAAWFGSTL